MCPKVKVEMRLILTNLSDTWSDIYGRVVEWSHYPVGAHARDAGSVGLVAELIHNYQHAYQEAHPQRCCSLGCKTIKYINFYKGGGGGERRGGEGRGRGGNSAQRQALTKHTTSPPRSNVSGSFPFYFATFHSPWSGNMSKDIYNSCWEQIYSHFSHINGYLCF